MNDCRSLRCLPLKTPFTQMADNTKVTDIEEDFRAKIADFNAHGTNAGNTALLKEVTSFNLADIRVTGLLYFVGPCLVHFLEGATDSLLEVMRNMHPGVLNTKVM